MLNDLQKAHHIFLPVTGARTREAENHFKQA